MLNLIISVAAGVIVAAGLKLAHFSWPAGIIPGVLVMLGAYVILARRVATKVQSLVKLAEKELGGSHTSVKDRDQKVDRAIKILEQGLAFERWQFLIGSEVHAQIGMLQYMTGNLDAALPHLSEANQRNYMAYAMRGALAFRKKDPARMRACFETATKSGRKEPLVWATYAWCLTQLKAKDEALKVMSRGVEANPNDEKLKAGLTALQNDKKLKMRAFAPMWYQFGLEQPPMEMAGGRAVRFSVDSEHSTLPV